MNKGNWLHNYKNCVLSVALIMGMAYGVTVPAFAVTDWSANGIANNTLPSKIKTSKADRIRALEYAGIVFEKARAAGGKQVAPYEYYMAEAYLKLAEEEFSKGDQIGVIPISAESKKYSLMVIEKAKGEAK